MTKKTNAIKIGSKVILNLLIVENTNQGSHKSFKTEKKMCYR